MMIRVDILWEARYLHNYIWGGHLFKERQVIGHFFCRSVHHREASSLIGCPQLPPSPLVRQTFLSQNDLLGRQYQVHQGHPRLKVQKD